jgi:phenylpyruvate tautomerase PptA (4-oxalocrotonate tautomerase family)
MPVITIKMKKTQPKKKSIEEFDSDNIGFGEHLLSKKVAEK